MQKLFGVLGCEEQYIDPRFNTADARVANTSAVNALLTGRFGRDKTSAWLERLMQAGVPVAEIRDFAAVVADPQFADRNAIVEFDSPNDATKRMRVVGAGYVATDDGPTLLRPPPKLGEHTDELLAELGYSRTQIEDLHRREVV